MIFLMKCVIIFSHKWSLIIIFGMHMMIFNSLFTVLRVIKVFYKSFFMKFMKTIFSVNYILVGDLGLFKYNVFFY